MQGTSKIFLDYPLLKLKDELCQIRAYNPAAG